MAYKVKRSMVYRGVLMSVGDILPDKRVKRTLVEAGYCEWIPDPDGTKDPLSEVFDRAIPNKLQSREDRPSIGSLDDQALDQPLADRQDISEPIVIAFDEPVYVTHPLVIEDVTAEELDTVEPIEEPEIDLVVPEPEPVIELPEPEPAPIVKAKPVKTKPKPIKKRGRPR